jgi:hypothetical protein
LLSCLAEWIPAFAGKTGEVPSPANGRVSGPTKLRLSTESEVRATALNKSSTTDKCGLPEFLRKQEWRDGRAALK